MSYTVDLLDKSSLAKIKEIEIVNEPKIHEEINGSFTLDFEAHYSAKNDLNNNVIVAVDGKYFKIAKVIKSRDDSITLSVHCEHISYDLIVNFELSEDMAFESDARTMIEQFLSGTRFRLVDCMATDVKYYTTNTLDIRKRLFEVANLFGGELIFDNFNVSLVWQRGSNKGLTVELGVNLIGVTEESNFVENKTSYELDLVDLSGISNTEINFSSAEIGDTITIIDNVLGINTSERILAIDYNPFQKALPSVTVGDYVRDLTEYLKPEPEEEEEKEFDIKDLFKTFTIGGINMIKNAADVTDDVREYLTNKYELGVEVSATYNTLKNELVGIVAEAAASNRILSVIQTKTNESGLLVTTITPITSSNQLSSVKINDTEHITLVLSDKPLSHYKENPNEAENANIAAIGVCITFNDDVGVFLEKFSIGNISLLGTENLDATDNVSDFIRNHVVPPVANAEIEIEEKVKGLVVVPTEEYMDWHLTLLHGIGIHVNDGVSYSDIEIHELPLEDYANFEVVTWEVDSVVAVISNEPFSTIRDGTASEDAYYKAFGAKFLMNEIDESGDDASKYFDEFRIDNIDMIGLVSDETDNFINSILIDNVDPADFSTSAMYGTDSMLRGLFITLKEEYQDYYLSILNIYYNGSGQVHGTIETWDQASSWIGDTDIPYLENDEIFVAIISNVPLFEEPPEDVEPFVKAFGITVTMGEVDDGDDSGAKRGIFMEYGTCELSDYMHLQFEKGPYEEVLSVVTGLTLPEAAPATLDTPATLDAGSIQPLDYSFPDMTIYTELDQDWWDGTVYGIRAYTTNPFFSRAIVNFQVICKNRVEPRVED